MLVSTVSTGDLITTGRWDAEAFEPGLLQLLSAFKNQPTLGTIADITHPTEILRTYSGDAEAVPFLLAGNIRPVLPEVSEAATISAAVAQGLPTNRLKYGDILVTRTGANHGVACVFLAPSDSALTSAEGLIVRLREARDQAQCEAVDPAYLGAFLGSAYGQRLCRRAAYGSGQPHISPTYLKHIPIPRLGRLEKKIGDLVREAYECSIAVEPLYAEAEEELLDRLGWDMLKSRKVELTYVVNSRRVQLAERWDAEHFEPQNHRLLAKLKARGSRPLGSIVSYLGKGVQPEFVENGQVAVIDSKSVRHDVISPSVFETTSSDFYKAPANEKARVRHGDVLLNSTGRGTLGRAGCYLSDKPAIADNHVAIIRPDTSICVPEYLSLFLNSPPGRQQTEMFQCGSSGQLELYPSEAAKVMIFLPLNSKNRVDIAWQKTLAEKITRVVETKERVRKATKKALSLLHEGITNTFST